MAVDMFINMGPNIKGESQDDQKKEWIDVLAWSWGVSQSGTTHMGGGGGAGKSKFSGSLIHEMGRFVFERTVAALCQW